MSVNKLLAVRHASLRHDLQLFYAIVTALLQDEIDNPVTAVNLSDEQTDLLDLSLSDNPMSEQDFTDTITELVLKTPKTASHLFFNQLFGGRNTKALLGDLLAVILNNSMATYKVAGPQVTVEKNIIKKIGELIGYSTSCDGTFAAGGSTTNFMGMLMARDAKNASIKTTGLSDVKYTIYTSNQAHYSVSKNASFCGIGRNNVRSIATNTMGQMDIVDLQRQIKQDLALGCVPFFINATAGTTVLSAFDPLAEISTVAKQYDMWLHVDGAYGGAVMFSHKYKHLINGSAHTDSFSLNAHKVIGTPLSCSMIVTKHRSQLFSTFTNDADYLYQEHDDTMNLGKISMQCGRRNDALKFWALWKALGTIGIETIVNHQFALADYARDYVQNNADYQLYSFDNSLAVCFNYKHISAVKLCTLLSQKAKILVGFGEVDGVECIRWVSVNAQNNYADVTNFFTLLEKFVAQHETELLQV